MTLGSLRNEPAWFQRLNREYDGPLSNFACFGCNCSLRRYTTGTAVYIERTGRGHMDEVGHHAVDAVEEMVGYHHHGGAVQVEKSLNPGLHI